jgi:nucleotide-binding universal stress UspA family protein
MRGKQVARKETMMFSKILLATDLENHSMPALRMAAALAAAEDATLFVLHVVELPRALRRWSVPTARREQDAYRSILDRQVQAGGEDLARLVARVPRCRGRTRTLVRVGPPADTIADTADELKADLIVVARGRGGRLGATSEKVVRLVGRTVLVAPVKLGRGDLTVLPFLPLRSARGATRSRISARGSS